MAVRRYQGGAQVLGGESSGPEPLVEAIGSRPADRARRQVAEDGAGEPRARHRGRRLPARAGAPRLPVPRAVRGARVRPRDIDDPAASDAVLVAALAAWQREEIRGRGLTDLLNEVELPLVRVLRNMEVAGVKLDTERLREISARVKAEADALEQRDLRARRRGVHDRLSQAARGDPVRQARPLAQAPRQDRLLDRRPGAPGDPGRARGDSEDRALPRADQARPDVPRRAPRLHRRRRPPAHDLQPDDRDHRPAVVEQPEPPEHPDPDRARPRDPRVLRRRTGQPARLGGLLAGRAPAAGPHRRRGRAQGDLPPRRGRPHRHRLPGLQRHAGSDRSGDALEVEDDQLRDRLRPVGVRDGRPARHPPVRGRRVHPALPRGLSRRSAGSSRRRSSRAPSTATSRRCSAAAARYPSCAPAAGSCASRASGSRSTW